MNPASEAPARVVLLQELPGQELEPVLVSETGEWLDVLGWNYSPSAEVFRYMTRERVLPGIAVVLGGRCVGYAYYLFRGRRCILGAYALPAYRDDALMARMFERLFREPAFLPMPPNTEGHVQFVAALGELGDLLSNRGFFISERRLMRLEACLSPAAVDPPPGTLVRAVDHGRLEDLALVMAESYRDHPDHPISSLYENAEGCLDLLSQVLRQDGCGESVPGLSLAVEAGGMPTGCVLVTRISKSGYFIPQIFVHPSHQGMGFGRLLLDSAIARVSALFPGADVALSVSVRNEKALHWYERRGFRAVCPQFSFSRSGLAPSRGG